MFDFLQGYHWSILKGAWLSIEIALLSLLLALVLGMIAALAKLSRRGFFKALATLYTTIIRGVPDLILMMLLFYGGQMLLNNLLYYANEWQWLDESINAVVNGLLLFFNRAHKTQDYLPDYVEISPYIAGILTIGFILGAYMAETFRGAIMAVDKGAMEAARAYGMSPMLAFWRILFPQMMRHVIPGIGNNWLVLLKTTALVSIIGLDDMVRVAYLAAGTTKSAFTFYMTVSVIYLFFTAISIGFLKLIERHYALEAR